MKQWALNNAGMRTLERYNLYGQPFTFGSDIEKDTGVTYLSSGLVYTDQGDKGVKIQSPMLKTDKDYWNEHFPFPKPEFLPDPGCYHYCKLLSPARAMEWIYLDGLRRHMPING